MSRNNIKEDRDIFKYIKYRLICIMFGIQSKKILVNFFSDKQ